MTQTQVRRLYGTSTWLYIMLYSRCYEGSSPCYITCYIAGPPLLCLDIHLAGSPRDARAQIQAVSVPSTSGDPLEAPEVRDLDWEDNYKQEPAAGGGRQAENPFAALLAWIPDFNTEEFECLQSDVPTRDDAKIIIPNL